MTEGVKFRRLPYDLLCALRAELWPKRFEVERRARKIEKAWEVLIQDYETIAEEAELLQVVLVDVAKKARILADPYIKLAPDPLATEEYGDD